MIIKNPPSEDREGGVEPGRWPPWMIISWCLKTNRQEIEQAVSP